MEYGEISISVLSYVVAIQHQIESISKNSALLAQKRTAVTNTEIQLKQIRKAIESGQLKEGHVIQLKLLFKKLS